jgi:hypothetical protein
MDKAVVFTRVSCHWGSVTWMVLVLTCSNGIGTFRTVGSSSMSLLFILVSAWFAVNGCRTILRPIKQSSDFLAALVFVGFQLNVTHVITPNRKGTTDTIFTPLLLYQAFHYIGRDLHGICN